MVQGHAIWRSFTSSPAKATSKDRVYCECPSVEGPPYSLFLHPTPLLPLPERAKRAVLAVREVLPLLVRAAHVALGHGHGLDPVLPEELLKLPLHLRVGRNVCPHPPHDDRLGSPVANDPGGD